MAFTLYSLIQTAILCTNAIAVLHEERFLSKSEFRQVWCALNVADGVAGEQEWASCCWRTEEPDQRLCSKLVVFHNMRADVSLRRPGDLWPSCWMCVLFCSRLGGRSGSRRLRRRSRSQSPDSASHPLRPDRHERLETRCYPPKSLNSTVPQASDLKLTFRASACWRLESLIGFDLLWSVSNRFFKMCFFCSSLNNRQLGLYRPVVGVWVTSASIRWPRSPQPTQKHRHGNRKSWSLIFRNSRSVFSFYIMLYVLLNRYSF